MSGVIVTNEAVTTVTLVTLGSSDGGNEPVTLVTLVTVGSLFASTGAGNSQI